jgi:putative ABC transport system ATP-binding protein
MIQVKHLSKTFGSGDTQVQALKEINFTIETGAFASIIGKSGSGKSTLMSLLGALDSPSTGEVIVGDRDITKLSGRALTKYRAKDIGFVFQGYNLIPNLTALENVMLPMEYVGTKNRASRAAELLDKVGNIF